MRIFAILALGTAVTSEIAASTVSNRRIWGQLFDNIGKALKPKDAATASPTSKPTESKGFIGNLLDTFEGIFKDRDVPMAITTPKASDVAKASPTAKPTAAKGIIVNFLDTFADIFKERDAATASPTLKAMNVSTSSPTGKPTASPTAKPTAPRGIWGNFLDIFEDLLEDSDDATASPTPKPTASPAIIGNLLDLIENVWKVTPKAPKRPRTSIERMLDDLNAKIAKVGRIFIKKPRYGLTWNIKELIDKLMGAKTRAQRAMKMAKRALMKATKLGEKAEAAKKRVKQARNAKALEEAGKMSKIAIKVAQNAMKKFQHRNRKALKAEQFVDKLMRSIQELIKNGGAKKSSPESRKEEKNEKKVRDRRK